MSMERWVVSPEVAGELGDDSVVDSSVHPPRVSRFHHRFEGWLGDELLEAFPCWLVSSLLAKALEEANLVGFSLGEVEVSVSPEFLELYLRRILPEFRWLEITGGDRTADFFLTSDFRLEISSRALEVLKKFNIAHAEIKAAEEWSPREPE